MAISNINRNRQPRRQMPRVPDLLFWYKASDPNSITKAYQDLTQTGSGSSGGTTITASASVANLVVPGMNIRIGGTDVYVVSTVVTTTITIVGTLSATYGAGSALAVERVSQWNDKSGLQNHATQGTALSQPLYIPNAVKGKATLGFDGASTLQMPSGTHSITSGVHNIFVVTKRTTETGSLYRVMAMNNGGGAGGNFRFVFGFSATSGSIQYGCNGTGTVTTAPGGTNTEYQILLGRMLIGQTAQRVQINNTSDTGNTSGAAATVDSAFIGSNFNTDRFLIGEIAEIIGIQRDLEIAERVSICRYLGDEWGISIS
jgi:hypothetical protein